MFRTILVASVLALGLSGAAMAHGGHFGGHLCQALGRSLGEPAGDLDPVGISTGGSLAGARRLQGR